MLINCKIGDIFCMNSDFYIKDLDLYMFKGNKYTMKKLSHLSESVYKDWWLITGDYANNEKVLNKSCFSFSPKDVKKIIKLSTVVGNEWV